MRVKFLRKHRNWNEGEEYDVPENIAAYLIRTGVATIEEETPEATEKKLTKKLKAKKTAKKK